ncbi:TPA: ATP-grasp domain-containing protein [Bacillus cereus]
MIDELALKIVKKLNLCGSAGLKVVLNSNYVLEVNPRISGTTLLGRAYTDICIPAALIDMADNTWNNNLDLVTVDKLSLELDLIPNLSKSILGEVYAFQYFLNVVDIIKMENV